MNKKEKKLIEYLNQMMIEQWKETRFTKIVNDYDFFACNNFWDMWLWYETIISKKFWFIQWLCDKRKVDFLKCKYWFHVYKNYEQIIPEMYEYVILALAIQKEPIKYLLRLLK